MRLLSVRLIVSLILGVTLVSLLSTYYEVRREKQGLRNELERRAEVLGESLVGNVEPYLDGKSLKQLQKIVGRLYASVLTTRHDRNKKYPAVNGRIPSRRY